MDHMWLTWVCVRASGSTGMGGGVGVGIHTPTMRDCQNEFVLPILHQIYIFSKRPSDQGQWWANSRNGKDFGIFHNRSLYSVKWNWSWRVLHHPHLHWRAQNRLTDIKTRTEPKQHNLSVQISPVSTAPDPLLLLAVIWLCSNSCHGVSWFWLNVPHTLVPGLLLFNTIGLDTLVDATVYLLALTLWLYCVCII